MRDKELIEKHIDESLGIADARLWRGIAVWAIVAYWKAMEQNSERVAYEFDIQL